MWSCRGVERRKETEKGIDREEQTLTNGDKLKQEKKSFGKQKMNKYETALSKDKRVFKRNKQQFYLKRKTLKRTKNR